jgi:hypothetical protein
MIAGEPLLPLRNFHEMLTNIPRHPPEREIGRSVGGERDVVCREQVPPFFVNIS